MLGMRFTVPVGRKRQEINRCILILRKTKAAAFFTGGNIRRLPIRSRRGLTLRRPADKISVISFRIARRMPSAEAGGFFLYVFELVDFIRLQGKLA